MACPRRGRAVFHGVNARVEFSITPVDHSRRFDDEHGICFTTIRDWVDHAAEILWKRPGLEYVSIIDRTPLVVEVEETTGLDRHHVEIERGWKPSHHWADAYGWMHGYRWMMTPEESEGGCSVWHLPWAIFRHLSDCSYPAIVRDRARGKFTMPRWSTPGGAMNALNAAAWYWAVHDGSRE